MINIILPSSKPPENKFVYGGTSSYTAPLVSKQTQEHQPNILPPNTDAKLYAEAMRRHKIIVDMLKNIPYKEKDLVQPVSTADQEKYGRVFIVDRIVRSYVQWSKQEPWPANDFPKIVQCINSDNGELVICTPNFMCPYVESTVS